MGTKSNGSNQLRKKIGQSNFKSLGIDRFIQYSCSSFRDPDAPLLRKMFLFKEIHNSHQSVLATQLCNSTKQMAGNPGTFYKQHEHPPLKRSSGKLSPSESASFRIFSTSLLLQMDFKLLPPKIMGKARTIQMVNILYPYRDQKKASE